MIVFHISSANFNSLFFHSIWKFQGLLLWNSWSLFSLFLMDGTCSHDCFDCTGKDELFDGQWYRCWAGQVWWVLLCYSFIYTMDICLRTIVNDIGGVNLVNSTLLLHHHLDGWISRSILCLTLYYYCWHYYENLLSCNRFFFFFVCV